MQNIPLSSERDRSLDPKPGEINPGKGVHLINPGNLIYWDPSSRLESDYPRLPLRSTIAWEKQISDIRERGDGFIIDFATGNISDYAILSLEMRDVIAQLTKGPVVWVVDYRNFMLRAIEQNGEFVFTTDEMFPHPLEKDNRKAWS